MGLRQSKRVDITGSPKKEAPAAVVEKTPQNNDAGTIEKNEEEIKSAINGDTKTAEPLELVNTHYYHGFPILVDFTLSN